MTRIVLLFVFSLSIASCVSINLASKKDVEKTFTVNKSFDDTWASLVKYFSQKGLPIKNIDKQSGIIAADRMRFDYDDKSIFACDTISKAGRPLKVNTDMTLNIFVERKYKNETLVTVNVFGSAIHYSENEYDTTASLNCYSTGEIEKRVSSYISTN